MGSSTAEYVRTVINARRQTIERLFDLENDGREDPEYGDPTEALDEMPLSIETRKVVEVTFGIGGPADWLTIELDANGDVESVYFEAAWGSDSYRASVGRSDALWTYAERIASYYEE